jgi:hypothetical protein
MFTTSYGQVEPTAMLTRLTAGAMCCIGPGIGTNTQPNFTLLLHQTAAKWNTACIDIPVRSLFPCIRHVSVDLEFGCQSRGIFCVAVGHGVNQTICHDNAVINYLEISKLRVQFCNTWVHSGLRRYSRL